MTVPNSLFPQGWTPVRLMELAEINPEALGAETPPNVQFGYIDLSAVERGWINWEAVRDLGFASSPSRARRVVRPRDVLFGTVRPALQSHAAIPEDAPEHLIASTGFAVVRAREDVADSRFLYHLIMSDEVAVQARRFEVGSNYPAVNEADVRLFIVPKAPVAEQQVIAQILDTVDAAIRCSERLLEKLQLVRVGVLHDVLGWSKDGLSLASTHDKSKESLQDERLHVTISEIAAKQLGSTVIGPFGSNLLASDYRTHGSPVIFVRDIQAMAFTWNSNVHVSESKARELQAHHAIPGDVLVTKMGDPPGIACVYPSGMSPGVITADLIRIRVDPNVVRPEWAAIGINGPDFQKQVRSAMGGITRNKLTLGEFRRLRIPVPNLEEQDRAIDTFDAVYSRIVLETAFLNKLRMLKSGLASDFLSGGVRVWNLLQEVA